ncbi:hypothetical protein EDD16DRAFT_1773704 [Pisolithus croceorrhizus]|nr:hypothetical protein EV401DRAFT_2156995 [Pisolithus croceorrhizus]KAI6096429.1 hypothetical protein EDD16DRAFT_1773704 [Pisolithus croceorrhizus]
MSSHSELEAAPELVYNAEALQANVERDSQLSQLLKTFNESFASLLYVMDMSALTTDSPQVPTDTSFQLALQRAEENTHIAAGAASKATKAIPPPPPPDIDADKTTYTDNADYEMTFMTAANVTSTSTATTTAKPPTKAMKKAKPKLSK